ncbi:GntR family transcriptional regulator [Streptomyces asiaticus]
MADHIRQKILSGEYAPGSRMVEQDLAKELDISRNTLRVALQALAFEGLLVQNQFKSTHVRMPSAQDVFEIYTLRNALEAMACRLAARRAATVGTAAIDATLEQMSAAVKAEDVSAMIDADFAFHSAVVDLAGHSRLREHYRVIHSQTRLYLNMTSRVGYKLSYIKRIHTELADAIRAQNVDLAERLGGSHSTEDGERLCAMLRADEETEAGD